ncbi:PHB depolymerase family esterase [Diaporthe helianthi]|uniref:PHB depolymerase family esterase n=1 Tax=Diaporthe helianthi TaxID=158607 RepID=A0A2P5I6T5_DIAHE|nr:PHB depolymerase family esterase [Diaporthe helianthi]
MVTLSRFVAGAAALAATTQAASLQQVTDFGPNTSETKMYLYAPDSLSSAGNETNAPVVVAIHYCTGTAEAYFFWHALPGFGRAEALSHGGGADTSSIVEMVSYTLSTYGADASRVFVTGSSSGAMMTNVLAATYPDVFKAATVYSGVPAGCFYTGTVDGWNSVLFGREHPQPEGVGGYCVGHVSWLYWSEAEDACFPWDCGHDINFNETIKQWTGVFGYSDVPEQTLEQTPSAAYTKYVYGENVVGIYGTGIGHTVPVMGDQDMAWFGIS